MNSFCLQSTRGHNRKKKYRQTTNQQIYKQKRWGYFSESGGLGWASIGQIGLFDKQIKYKKNYKTQYCIDKGEKLKIKNLFFNKKVSYSQSEITFSL